MCGIQKPDLLNVHLALEEEQNTLVTDYTT